MSLLDDFKYVSKNGLRRLFNRGLKFVWQGSQDDWDALPASEKAKYDMAITNESSSVITNMPYGAVQAFAGNTVPKGWLLCNGQAVSRNIYVDLFNAIGTTYGSGDGSTTFNVPDYRECALVGVGMSTTNTISSHDEYTLGEFKDDQVQSHAHVIRINKDDSGGAGYPMWGPNNVRGTADLTTISQTGRQGTVTRGKRKGVNYIIFAGV